MISKKSISFLSFPFYRARPFRWYIIYNPVYASYTANNAVRDPCQNFIWIHFQSAFMASNLYGIL